MLNCQKVVENGIIMAVLYFCPFKKVVKIHLALYATD